MVRVLDDFQPKICYLKLVEPPNTKADGIVVAIDAAFDEFEMPDYKNKTVGFCSDGASVMMGKKQGVIQKIKDQGQAPWILAMWCLAHRLELALIDCFKGEYLETVVDVLTSSAKRIKEAGEIADIMETQFTKPEKCNGTRWVDHNLRAISKLIKNWKVLVMHMMSYSEDATNGAEHLTDNYGDCMTEFRETLNGNEYFGETLLKVFDREILAGESRRIVQSVRLYSKEA
ncbi:ZN862-like protein [Mya arenaria]|uniref:ZN862-like protein n=1 Tax=Mya arenaria TaxID=6604 RepID=A0ABY7F196_MYAAR|nr:ZN862-like protein [Mya arenaria]